MPECDAKMRPFRPVKELEVQCTLEDGHEDMHEAVLRDYAWQGSRTKLFWADNDRRIFRGFFRACGEPTCILPDKHRGKHA